MRTKWFFLEIQDVLSDLSGCNAERRLSEAVFDVQFCALLDEKLHDSVSAGIGGAVQGGPVIGISGIHVSAKRDEHLRGFKSHPLLLVGRILKVSKAGSDHQRSCALGCTQQRVG